MARSMTSIRTEPNDPAGTSRKTRVDRVFWLRRHRLNLAFTTRTREQNGQQKRGVLDRTERMRLIAQEEKPVASPKDMRLVPGGEGDLPVEAINRDWTLNPVISHLAVFAEHHPDGLKFFFFHQ